MKYLERRMVHGALLLIGVSVLCFLFTDFAPGNFFDEMKLNPQISSDTVAALRSQYGVDQPLPVRYSRWVKSVMKGEWGYSFAYNSPVRGLILLRARNTLLLTGCATLIAWLIAVPLGLWTASRAGSWPDHVCMSGTSFFLAVPEMVVVFGLLYFVIRSHALPAGGMISRGFEQFGLAEKVVDLAKHLIVPVLTLVLASLPILVRHVRASMIEVLSAPFIAAARGHGISRGRILFRYALPVGANPLISLFGLSLAGVLSGSLLVGSIIGWPGLGALLLEGFGFRDLFGGIGGGVSSTGIMIMWDFLADALLVAVDPRVRTE